MCTQTHTDTHTQALTNSDQSLGDFLCHAGSFIQRGGYEQTLRQTNPQTFSFYALLFTFVFFLTPGRTLFTNTSEPSQGLRSDSNKASLTGPTLPLPQLFSETAWTLRRINLERSTLQKPVCAPGGKKKRVGEGCQGHSGWTHGHWTQTGVKICRRERQRDPTSLGSLQKEPIDFRSVCFFLLICLKTSRLELYSGYILVIFLQLQPLQLCVPRFPLRSPSFTVIYAFVHMYMCLNYFTLSVLSEAA